MRVRWIALCIALRAAPAFGSSTGWFGPGAAAHVTEGPPGSETGSETTVAPTFPRTVLSWFTKAEPAPTPPLSAGATPSPASSTDSRRWMPWQTWDAPSPETETGDASRDESSNGEDEEGAPQFRAEGIFSLGWQWGRSLLGLNAAFAFAQGYVPWAWPRFFSDSEAAGALRTHGGWVGWAIDHLGLQAFGQWWATVGWWSLAMILVAALSVLKYGIEYLMTPFYCLARLGRYLCGRPTDPMDLLPLLPHSGRMRRVDWHGPGTSTPAETSFFTDQVRGRGSQRRMNHVLVRREGALARIIPAEDTRYRLDHNGLRMNVKEIAGCTSHAFRTDLGRDSPAVIHLCRKADCKDPTRMHFSEYAVVDATDMVDLRAHSMESWFWRCLRFGWRIVWLTFAFVHWAALGCPCRLLRWLCCARKPARTIKEKQGGQIVERILHDDSESEPEDPGEAVLCEAVRVGIRNGKAVRALCQSGCIDSAQERPTVLLADDVAVSDVSPPQEGGTAAVRLCMCHDQIYRATRYGDKCARTHCYRTADTERDGVAYCPQHAADSGGEEGTAQAAGRRANSQEARARRNSRGRRPSLGAASEPEGVGPRVAASAPPSNRRSDSRERPPSAPPPPPAREVTAYS